MRLWPVSRLSVYVATRAGCATHILLGQVDVGAADLKLELADSVTHGDAHGTCRNEVGDLRREMGHEVAGEGVVCRRVVVLDDLEDRA